jgi:solute carrier family 25 (mitochondrial folate transporter), member 32
MAMEKKPVHSLNQPSEQIVLWISLLSGAGAGLICSILCSPLDVVKVRMQVQGSLGIKKYNGGVISTIAMIYREEGIRGTFKGIGPALITAPLFWGVYWPLYGYMKPLILEKYPDMNSHLVHLISAISAGGVADVITNPFWVTRTRIQTLALHTEEHLSNNISTYQMMKRIYEQEGIIAFYRGLTASLLGLSHVAIQFPLCK